MEFTSEHRIASLNRGRVSVLRLLLIVSGTIFVSQLAVQYVMTLLPPVPVWAEAVLHAFVLSSVVLILLMKQVVRPFARYELEIDRHSSELERRVEERTRELARFAEVLDATPDFAGTADANGRGLWLNAGGRLMLGFGVREDVTGFDVTMTYPERIRPLVAERMGIAMQTGSWSGETIIVRRDGRELPVSQVLLVHRAADGSVDFVSTIMRDMSEHIQQEADIARRNAELEEQMGALEVHAREAKLLGEMGDLVQAAVDPGEMFGIIGRYAERLLQTESGAVYVYSPSRNDLECALGWGSLAETGPAQSFAPGDCWSLRRGRPHAWGGTSTAPACIHLHGVQGRATLCVPMMAHGDVVGMLHLRHTNDGIDQRLPTAISDQVALALANLKLRESLRNQSIRDSLTGLFNRRYLEETLEREMRRATRTRQSVGLIMLDLDHFKLLNDTHGHQAGDAVLQELGAFLRRGVRGGDIACRYGGEEFVLVLPDSPLADTTARAESLRDELRSMRVMFAGQPLGPVTFSCGVVSFPDHGATVQGLLQLADTTLYRAKHEGRDRVITAEVPVQTA